MKDSITPSPLLPKPQYCGWNSASRYPTLFSTESVMDQTHRLPLTINEDDAACPLQRKLEMPNQIKPLMATKTSIAAVPDIASAAMSTMVTAGGLRLGANARKPFVSGSRTKASSRAGNSLF
jgi:hypothetical protein